MSRARQSETVQRWETGERMNETAERLDQNVWIYIEHQSLLILPPHRAAAPQWMHYGGSQPFCGVDSSCNPSDLLQDYSFPSRDLTALQKIHISTCQTHSRCHLNFKRYISTVTSASRNSESKCNSSLCGLPQTYRNWIVSDIILFFTASLLLHWNTNKSRDIIICSVSRVVGIRQWVFLSNLKRWFQKSWDPV